MTEESVRGIIIGEMTWPYQFWTPDGTRKIASRSFENDRDAEAWVKAHYPDDYAQGIDMRCFEQPCPAGYP